MSQLKRNGLLPEDSEKPSLPALPADLAAVQADDALLDALYSGTAPSDADVARVLLAWRRDVDAESIPTLVDVDTALALVRARSRRSLAGRVADAVRRLIGGDR
jgi:hypothetical protein